MGAGQAGGPGRGACAVCARTRAGLGRDGTLAVDVSRAALLDWARQRVSGAPAARDLELPLFALSAYVGDRLIGYSVNFLMRHLHYADLVYAQNDLLFIDKDYRASRAGLALIRATEAHAKAKGAQMLIWHAKPGTALEALLPRMGYGVQDIMFSKEV